MEGYVKATILGGYHNGQEYTIDSKSKRISLVEDKEDIPTYSSFSTVVDKQFKIHHYRKLDFIYRKQFKRGELVNSWYELEDINVFIPSDTPLEYEETLKQVIGKALKSSWIPKYEEI